MRCVDVFRRVEVLHFVERTERREGDDLAYERNSVRERIIEEIIGECERQTGGKEIRI